MKLSDMVVGNKYLVGDGGGYDIVTCLSHLTQQEIVDFLGEDTFRGVAVKVMVSHKDGDYEDVFYEAYESSFSLYIEPR